MIQEIEMHGPGSDRAAMIHISVDGREYMLVGAKGWVTILAGRRWINSRRALGRTFHNLTEIVAHYRQHGSILLEYANRVVAMA